MLGAEAALQLRDWLPLEPPVDCDVLAAALGVRLIELELEAEIDGLVARPGRETWIVTRPGLSAAERRLAVLHEAGHVLLHAGNSVYVRLVDERWADSLERAAEEFALCYGAPSALLGAAGDEYELAELSGLPVEACRRRLGMAVG